MAYKIVDGIVHHAVNHSTAQSRKDNHAANPDHDSGQDYECTSWITPEITPCN